MENFKSPMVQIMERMISNEVLNFEAFGPGYIIPQETEDIIADEMGYLREWDHITETYTESQLDWLIRMDKNL